MKRHRNLTWLVAFLTIQLIVGGGIADAQPKETNIRGRISLDFPDAPEATIEINLSGKLFSLVAKSVKPEPKIAELIAMVEGVYVRGYDNSVENLDGVTRHYESMLKRDNWEVIAKVKEKGETVHVRMLFDQDLVSGLFVMVATPEETYFVNIFGRIDFEKIGDLLEHLDEMNLDVDLPQLNNLKIESKQKPEDK